MLLVSLAVLVGASFSYGANILAIVPSPSYSHQVAHQQLWRELSLRGHKVTVLTTDPVKDTGLTNLTEIDLSYIYEAVEKKFNQVQSSNSLKGNPIQLIQTLKAVLRYVLEEELSHSLVQKLIKNDDNQKFDVVLVEFIFFPMYAFAEIYKCPLIAISSVDVMSGLHSTVGNPIHPVTHPNTFLQIEPPLNFLWRLLSTLSSALLTVHTEYVENARQDLVVKKYFGDGISSIRELKNSISLLFLSIDPIFYPVKPLLPSIILVGGGSHIRSKGPLPNDLEEFIEDAPEGIIYFSLGSNVKTEHIGENTLKAVFEVFDELPFKVIWKFDANRTVKASKKLYLSKWLPQQAILENPNIKLFITQGGCQSLDEAIYNHIPVLGIPFFADQIPNMKRMVSRGIGLLLDYKTMSKHDFKNAILELINNTKYRNKVIELANLARDQPMTGLERAVWWTEYVIRHKGAKHLRSPFIDLPNYQYYHLDVIAFCLGVIVVVLYVCIKIVQLLLSVAKNISKTKQKIQ